MRNAYKILVRNSEGNSPPGRPKLRWENDIIMDLVEIVWEGMDWIHLA